MSEGLNNDKFLLEGRRLMYEDYPNKPKDADEKYARFQLLKERIQQSISGHYDPEDDQQDE